MRATPMRIARITDSHAILVFRDLGWSARKIELVFM